MHAVTFLLCNILYTIVQWQFVMWRFSLHSVCADVCDVGCVPAGEGYECTVTADDEDSKVIIFDNWKQVSYWPSASLLSHSVLLTSYSSDPLPVFLCSGDQAAFYFYGFAILCMYLRNGKSNLFNFCDGQIICVYSSVKSVFILVLLCVLFICVCVLRCAQSPAGEDVLTVLFELFEVLSFGKMEITLLLTFFFFFNSNLQLARTFWRGLKLQRLCLSNLLSFVSEWMSWFDPVAMIVEQGKTWAASGRER